jgi:hypothetical protein
MLTLLYPFYNVWTKWPLLDFGKFAYGLGAVTFFSVNSTCWPTTMLDQVHSSNTYRVVFPEFEFGRGTWPAQCIHEACPSRTE